MHRFYKTTIVFDTIVNYEKYKQVKPNDDRPDKGIESCMFALDALQNPSRYEITAFPHNTNQEEYSPCYASRDFDELFFTSSRDAP